MMKKILLAFFILISVVSSAQRLQKVNTYGYEYNRVAVDSLFALPSDTFSVPAYYQSYPWVTRKGTTLYLWNTSAFVWEALTAGSSTDTTSLSNRIDEKQNISDTNTVDATRYWVQQQGYADSLRRSGLNVQMRKNGVWATQYTDSTGGSSMTFTNGLTESGGTVKLGGTLTEQTTIDGQEPLTFSIDYIHSGQVIIDDGSVQINAVKNITGNSSKIKVGIDSINILPPNGNLFVDSINTVSSTTGRKVLVHDTATGRVERVDPALLGNNATLYKSGDSIYLNNGAIIYAVKDSIAGINNLGVAQTMYLDASTSFYDNQTLSPVPSSYPQETDVKAVTSATSPGFLERFVSGPVNTTSLPAGTWIVKTYGSTSNATGDNRIVTRINKRVLMEGMTGTFTGAGATRTFTVTGGTPFVPGDATSSILTASLIETPNQTAWISGYISSSVVTVTLTDVTYVNESNVSLNALYYLLFSTTSNDLTTSPTLSEISSAQSAFTVNVTDRLVAAYFAKTDAVSSRNISLYHGGSVNYSNIVTTLASTAAGGADSSVFATLYRVDTAKNNLRTSIAGKVSGSGTSGQLALWNGTSTITGMPQYTFSTNTSYPSMIIGSSGSASADIALRDAAGTFAYLSTGGGPLSLSASSTYKKITFYSEGNEMVQLYRPTTYNLISLNGLVRSNDLTVLSNFEGNFHVGRVVPYQVGGNNYHGFTDGTDFRQGSSAFNSFGSFVKIGNNRTNQDHYAAFQNVFTKDSSNTISKIYGFVDAVSEIKAGTITDLYGYYHYSPTVTGGTIDNHYGIYIPAVTGGNKNLAAYFGDSIQIKDGTEGAGKVLTSDANGGASWQTPASVADTSYTTIATFNLGGGFASDTAMCTDSTLFGSFYTGQFDYTIAYVQAVIKGNAGDSIVLKLVYNDTFNVDGTKVNGAGLSLNNRYTGNTFTISTNRTVPANSWLWLKPEAVITGKKPKYISVTLVGYKTYVTP